jgi:hypothetical protein
MTSPTLHLSARTALPPRISFMRGQADPCRWYSYSGSGPGCFSESMIRDSQDDECTGSTSRSNTCDSWHSLSVEP